MSKRSGFVPSTDLLPCCDLLFPAPIGEISDGLVVFPLSANLNITFQLHPAGHVGCASTGSAQRVSSLQYRMVQNPQPSQHLK